MTKRTTPAITIRYEAPGDEAGIRRVNREAFEQPVEADIVDVLRENCDNLVSLVAEREGEIVGHILFSPAVANSQDRTIVGMGLAPMCVLPVFHRRGIGSSLVEKGLEELRARGCPFVIVLGHSDYYPRFGFEKASERGLTCQWDGVPDEAFMVLVLDESAMKGVHGTARYGEEFDAGV